ncbi:hypothetical protein [Flavitalea sp.]|nr:hypothetical protein [Flavitalea sp.]
MKISKYLPFAIVYFFFNSFGLPFGLTFTTLLAPLFYYYILITRKKDVYLPFLFCFIVYYLIQSHYGVDDTAYLVSFLNLSGVYIFGQAFYTFLKEVKDPEFIFTKLLRINFILCLVAIPVYFTSFQDLLWIKQDLTEGIDDFRRLKMFTYEASYYATVMVPLFFFFLLQIILKQNRINTILLLAMIALPYVLSFSLGVMSCIALSLMITYVAHFRSLTRKRMVLNIITTAAILSVIIFLIAIIFFPENPLFVRIENILSDKDSSGRGRTYEAFKLALMILDQREEFWGIGPGQIKFLGAEIIRDFYLYPLNLTGMSIPNATAETLVIFGYFGLFLRIAIELCLFFATKVWNNYFQLLLFCFIFIYQFTGSFTTNTAEYVIWILAFTHAFPQFDIKAGSRLTQNQQ